MIWWLIDDIWFFSISQTDSFRGGRTAVDIVRAIVTGVEALDD